MVDVMQQSRDVTSETANLGFIKSQHKDTKSLHGRVIHERGVAAVRPKRAWGKPVEQNGFTDHNNTTEQRIVSTCA